MALFKTTRDQLKANALVSHLEFAQQQFRPRDMMRCEHHLKAAYKALAVVRQAKAEYILSDAGWHYIAQLAAQLRRQLLQSGFTQLAAEAVEIGHRACLILVDREDPVLEADFESPLESSEDAAPRIMRDPFPFPPFQPQSGEKTESPKEIPDSDENRRRLLIRLIRHRNQIDPSAPLETAESVTGLEEMPFEMLKLTADAAILFIVEQFYSLHGAESRIIAVMNQTHSAALGMGGMDLPIMEHPATLFQYVRHYVNSRFAHSEPVSDQYVRDAIRMIKDHYGR